MDRGASPRTGDVGSGPGGTKDAHKKALGPQDGGGGPSTVIALGGNGSGSSHPTKPVDLDANTKKRYRLRHFKRVKERRNRRKRDQDERLFTKGLKATATNEEPNRKERREHIQGFKPAKKTVKLSVPLPKPVIVDDGSNKFGSLHVESEVTSSLISKTTTVSTTTSVEEDVYWSPCESTGKPVISYKVEELDLKPWATVGDLMHVIQQEMGGPLSKYQHLQSIGGRPMQNAALLQHYDIQNNSTVVLSEPWPGHLLGGSLLSLKELIDKGSLNVGDIIVFREHNHQEEGELLENGWIRHEGTVYKSASAFVGAMRGKRSSGYDFLYTATGTPIQSLRSDPLLPDGPSRI